MSLKALQIVKEEFERLAEENPVNHDLLCANYLIEGLENSITQRIEKECIEIEKTGFCEFCGQTEENCVGGGYDDDAPAHDFTDGGLSTALMDPETAIPF
jgi:hypothetical protein